MADSKRYQVLTACVVVPIRTNDGEYLHTLYRGATFEASPEHVRVVHNVEAGYIVELGAKATAGVDGAGVAVVDNKRSDGSEAGSPVELNDPGVVNEAQQARSAAAAKLPADGSAPDGRASKDVWVEFLVRLGYDYSELVKQEKSELVDLGKKSK